MLYYEDVVKLPERDGRNLLSKTQASDGVLQFLHLNLVLPLIVSCLL